MCVRKHAMAVLSLLIARVFACSCDIMSIGDNMYPYVALLDPAVPVVWHQKFFAQRMAAAQAVRINSRGIRFISSQYAVLNIDPKSTSWVSVECTSSRQSLCDLTTGTTLQSRLLPNDGQQVYSTFGRHDDLTEVSAT
jgi:hypothetical protein